MESHGKRCWLYKINNPTFFSCDVKYYETEIKIILGKIIMKMVKFKLWKTLKSHEKGHLKSWNFKSPKEYKPCYSTVHSNQLLTLGRKILEWWWLCKALLLLCWIIFPLFYYRLSIIYAKFDEAARSGNMAINEPNGTYYIMPKKKFSLGSFHATCGDMVLLVLLRDHISFD